MNAAPVFVALALAFGVAAYRRPSLAVGGLVIVDPFALYRYVGPTTITLSKAALIGCAVGLALRRPSLKAILQPRIYPTLLAAIALILATALSFAQADYKEPAIRETLKAVEYVLIYVVCVIAIDTGRSDRSFAAASFAVLRFARDPRVVLIGARPSGPIACS